MKDIRLLTQMCMNMMVDGNSGFAIFQAIQEIKRRKVKAEYHYVYGIFLIEYGNYKRINGKWLEQQVNLSASMYHLKKAKHRIRNCPLLDAAIGECYFRLKKYRTASYYFAFAIKNNNKLEYTFWALMETLYLCNEYEEIVILYHKHKKENCPYSRDMENWIDLIFCYACIQCRQYDDIDTLVPILLRRSENVKWEAELFVLYTIGLLLHRNIYKQDYDVELIKLKNIEIPWLNMIKGGQNDTELISRQIVKDFTPCNLFQHIKL